MIARLVVTGDATDLDAFHRALNARMFACERAESAATYICPAGTLFAACKLAAMLALTVQQVQGADEDQRIELLVSPDDWSFTYVTAEAP